MNLKIIEALVAKYLFISNCLVLLILQKNLTQKHLS